MRIAYAGGGTGGHIYPALGIDDALRAALPAVAFERRFFGNADGLEAKLVTTMPLQFVPSAPLERRFSLAAFLTLARNAAGVAVALRALLAYRPGLLVATGGYVCFPVVLAARLLQLTRLLDCRVALLEINARPGLTSRLLGPLVDEVWIAYAGSGRFFGRKAVLTEVPVRASLLERMPRADARMALGLDPRRTTIVVMGGSQGARSINGALCDLVTSRAVPPGWQFLHICGERDFAQVREREGQLVPGNIVRLIPYLADPVAAYAAADIVVARAGASTLAELAVTRTPAVLVPYPFAADDHQTANARSFAAGGAAVVLPDADLSAQTLAATLERCLDDAALEHMRAGARAVASPAGRRKIVDRVVALLGARVPDSASPNEVARD